MIARRALMTVWALLCSIAQSQALDKRLLVGVWSYESAYTLLPDGRRVDQFGAHPKGLFIIMPNGWYSHIVINGDLPPLVSGVLKRLTDREAREIAHGTLSHFGTYTVNDDDSFTVTVTKSSFPNLDGVRQSRTILELTDTTLRYMNSVTTSGNGAQVYATLKRISGDPP